MLGAGFDDGIEFTVERHKLPGRLASLDLIETVFIVDLVGRRTLADFHGPPYRLAVLGARR